MNEYQLLRELKVIRDYFLLQNGYFYQHFIEDTAVLMSFPPIRLAERGSRRSSFSVALSPPPDPFYRATYADINTKFQTLLSQILINDGDAELKRVRRLKLALPVAARAMQQPSQSLDESMLNATDMVKTSAAWDGLDMEYEVPGPVALVLTSSSLRTFVPTFLSFLSVLRRLTTSIFHFLQIQCIVQDAFLREESTARSASCVGAGSPQLSLVPASVPQGSRTACMDTRT
jgi:hypothetical protein